MYVVQGAGGNLLSAKTAQDLNLVKLINTIYSPPGKAEETKLDSSSENGTDSKEEKSSAADEKLPTSRNKNIQAILDQYKDVCKGQGKLNNHEVTLHIKDDVKPVIQAQRRLPCHMRKHVSKEFGVIQLVRTL